MSDKKFNYYLEKVISAIDNFEKGEILASALINQEDCIPLLSSQEIGGIKGIHAIAGHSPQNITGEPISTSFYSYLNTVIQEQIISGEISDSKKSGEYDDRKLRWSGSGVQGKWFSENEILSLEVGVTTYQRYRQDLRRSKTESLQLMLRGLENYQDPFAYFSKTIGVTIIPIFESGNVYIGERSSQVDCPGLLNFVAGLATFKEVLEQINFYADAQQELQEEMQINLELDYNNTKFIGISGNPFTSETDLVFVVQTNIFDEYLNSIKLVEHSRFVCLKHKNDVENLLKKGFLPGEKEKKAIAYASRTGLEYLVKHHF